jgi:C4-dicarboxylate transporter DctM subunit
VPLREMPRITWEAFPALLMPIILFTCLYSGITTPTEAAAVAALYALVIAGVLYRSISARDIYRSLLTSARTTVSIGMLIAGAMAFNYVVTIENIPKAISELLVGMELSAVGYLMLVNVILLVLGCFLEGTTIILVILPVLLPTAAALGVDPVHFGVIAVTNIMFGLVTPPYGLLLFMMTKVTGVSLGAITREVLPFLGVMFVALLVITYVPGFVLFLPRLFGYSG